MLTNNDSMNHNFRKIRKFDNLLRILLFLHPQNYYTMNIEFSNPGLEEISKHYE